MNWTVVSVDRTF